MTRIKEPDPDLNNEVPNYKSPPPRIIRSLRQAYDNQRRKVKKKSETIQELREKLRDTQKSRDSWRERTKVAESELEEIKKKNEELENDIKKKASKS